MKNMVTKILLTTLVLISSNLFGTPGSPIPPKTDKFMRSNSPELLGLLNKGIITQGQFNLIKSDSQIFETLLDEVSEICKNIKDFGENILFITESERLKTFDYIKRLLAKVSIAKTQINLTSLRIGEYDFTEKEEDFIGHATYFTSLTLEDLAEAKKHLDQIINTLEATAASNAQPLSPKQFTVKTNATKRPTSRRQ